MPEVDAKIVGLCILRGLRDMHAGGYCHLDVKPDNVSMAEEGNLRTATLLDYGSAKPIGAATESQQFPTMDPHALVLECVRVERFC